MIALIFKEHERQHADFLSLLLSGLGVQTDGHIPIECFQNGELILAVVNKHLVVLDDDARRTFRCEPWNKPSVLSEFFSKTEPEWTHKPLSEKKRHKILYTLLDNTLDTSTLADAISEDFPGVAVILTAFATTVYDMDKDCLIDEQKCQGEEVPIALSLQDFNQHTLDYWSKLKEKTKTDIIRLFEKNDIRLTTDGTCLFYKGCYITEYDRIA